ncbi:DNA polymerase subunit gamma-1-like [Sycon ciliatum]|uniref:DNA polymerase subunit gamma-1-like n=1 Tax=Sycon ciliatum TaxID=27933 RepID=UPI0031F65504
MHSRLVPLRPLRCQANRRHASTKLKTYRLAPASSSTEHASVSGQQGASGNAEKQASPESGGKNTRHNLFGIQMLPDELRKPIFGERSSGTTSPDPVAALHARKELIEKYNLSLKSETQECPEFEMPQLLGSDVAEHFREIGRRQCQPYLQYADALMGVESLPGMPTKWQFTPGWCRYSAQCPQGKPVPFPDEKVLVFDVEVWMEAPTLPILAVAASPTAWLTVHSPLCLGSAAAQTFNYARIYGAGKKHATSLLLQFNHRLSVAEAESRAEILYNATKGKKRVKLSNRGRKLAESAALPVEQDGYLSVKHASALIHYSSESHEGKHSDEEDDDSEDDDDNSRFQNPQLFAGASYSGGSESHLFNRLEEMIKMRRPATPALGVTAPKPILRDNIQKQFVPSRINWIVQSSGVDFLHALLVNMRWLMDEFKIDGRLSISIHDEVRFLVAKEDRYRAALALHISNLLVRSLFSYQLNMNDLPQSVAFFSQVDIDSCMRKEVDLDCVTPSNPFGLRRGHAVDYGEGVDMAATVKKTGGSLRKPSAT